MPNTIKDEIWTVLIEKIREGSCLPFLGAGASYPVLPLGAQVAREWAAEYGFPLQNSDDLVAVAQFVAVKFHDPVYPKNLMARRLKNVAPPPFREPDEPHGALADLPLPVYMTTNYDDFMVRALQSRYKEPRQMLCRWSEAIPKESPVFDRGFAPNPANPVVLHLHGYVKFLPNGQARMVESLVLTEDDYLSFLAAIARDPDLLPPPIQEALTASSCLFIGYRLADWNFRVLFQGLKQHLRTLNVAVLLPPGNSEEERWNAQSYLERYYAAMNLHIYWGTAREFAADLRQRWSQSGA